MQNSKLVDVLRSFGTQDWRALREMCVSPYFNRNREVTALCEWLYAQSPQFDAATREAAHAGLFPGQTPDEARLNHLMSFLLKLAEDYLGLALYWKEKWGHAHHVLRALGDRNLDKHYQFHLEKSRRSFASYDKPDARFFYHQYALEIYEARRFVRNSPRQFNESVQKATDSLDAFYLLEKLRRTCYMYTSQAILATPYNLQLVEEVCRFVGGHLSEMATPAIEAYYRIFQLLSKPDAEDDFRALKLLLAQRTHEFGEEDLSDVYQYAINYCNIQIMKAREEFVSEAFDLYDSGVASRILLDNGVLSPWHFKNIVNLALKLKKYHWAEMFIVEHTPLLAAEFQSDARHYNLALLYYTTGRPGEALTHLNQVDFTDVHYSIGAKSMLCKIYYEQGDYDALDSLLHAFHTYLRRNKLISDNVRKAYIHFIQLLKKVQQALPRQYPAILEEVEKMQLLAGKEWLQEILVKR
ncbi:MAG: hypothetical protein SFV22_00970 [Saprospiraceae bacterium]|nr:hypothetical protein [Saprospiraceae bacterium]